MSQKIGILINTLGGGGAERIVFLLAQKFLFDGYPTDIILFNQEDMKYEFNNICSLEVFPNPKFTHRAFNFFLKIYRLYKLKKDKKYDVVISFLGASNFYNVITSTKNTRVIVGVRSYEELSMFDKGILFSIILHFANYIVAVSDGITNRISTQNPNCKNKIFTIKNPAVVRVSNSTKVVNQIRLHYDLITIGRLDYQKCQWLIIYAIKILNNSYDLNLKMCILGEGPLLNELRSLVFDLGLEENIDFIGFSHNVGSYLQNSKLFVLTSSSEGFPNSILDAITLGIPVIATDCDTGPREILNPEGVNLYDNDRYFVENKYGLLTIPPTTTKDIYISLVENEALIEQLVEKIKLMILEDDIRKHYSGKSINRSKDFDIDKIAKQYYDLFI
jgi:glycosyltransferase involved in cell wall biosynthesis